MRCVVCDDQGCEHCPATRDSRIRLVFKTPSRNCPLRIFNDTEVEITAVLPGRNVRRLGGRSTPQYLVTAAANASLHQAWLASGWASLMPVLADELHIDPIGD